MRALFGQRRVTDGPAAGRVTTDQGMCGPIAAEPYLAALQPLRQLPAAPRLPAAACVESCCLLKELGWFLQAHFPAGQRLLSQHALSGPSKRVLLL